MQRTLGTIPAGNLLIALVSQHYDEVARLVRTTKRCAAAWRRIDGTELLRRLLLWRDTQAALVPATINEEPIAPGLSRLLVEIHSAASPPLKRDISRYRALVLALPGATLQDIANLAEAHPA